MSEVAWKVDRAYLYRLWQDHPDWTHQEFATETGRSPTWVGKWLAIYKQADDNDPTLFDSRSRARKTPNKQIVPAVEDAILDIRDNPPDYLARVPGPKAIIAELPKREELAGLYLPTSTSTLWRILDANQRIYRRQPRRTEPQIRPEPMSELQIDFKSVSSVPPDPDGKQQHVVETLNAVDAGTSILVDAIPRPDYNAETALVSVIDIFMEHGLPETVSFDRDPRFVGSWNMQEFPSPFMRFLHAVGVEPKVCPPQRPDRNPYVERYNGSYGRECLDVHCPDTLEKVLEHTSTYRYRYNHLRPHQGLACNNVPPRVAFPDVQMTRRLPEVVDPDRWLQAAARRLYRRRVDSQGRIQIGNYRYYVGKKLGKQAVSVRILPDTKELQIVHDKQVVKTKPIQGLYHGDMSLEDYITYICREAVSEERRLAYKRRQKRRARWRAA